MIITQWEQEIMAYKYIYLQSLTIIKVLSLASQGIPASSPRMMAATKEPQQ